MTVEADHDSRSLDAIRLAIEAAENAGDTDYISGLFAEDAVVIVPDFPVQEGKGACTAFISGLLPRLLAAFERHVTYTSAELRVLGALAIDRGTFVFTIRPRDGGAWERVSGKYLWLYERDPAGTWKLARMVASRDEAGQPASAERSGAAHRLAAGLALVFGVFLAVAEVVRNWGDWSFWPFWVVDYIAVALLVAAWLSSRGGSPRAPALLAGAWGFTCAMFYMSFFLHHAGIGASDEGLLAHRTLTRIVGVLFAITVIGFVASVIGTGRPRMSEGDRRD